MLTGNGKPKGGSKPAHSEFDLRAQKLFGICEATLGPDVIRIMNAGTSCM